MNLREGTRRLALLLGGAGAVVGGFFSYAQLQSTLHQRADHRRFEQLENSSVVDQARKECFESSGPPEHGPWEKYQAPQEKPTFDPNASYCFYPDDNPNAPEYTAKLNNGGTETVHFLENRGIASVETAGGQTLYPTPAPGTGAYLLVAILPVLGFLIPWGVARAFGWVIAGFSQKGI